MTSLQPSNGPWTLGIIIWIFIRFQTQSYKVLEMVPGRTDSTGKADMIDKAFKQNQP